MGETLEVESHVRNSGAAFVVLPSHCSCERRGGPWGWPWLHSSTSLSLPLDSDHHTPGMHLRLPQTWRSRSKVLCPASAGMLYETSLGKVIVGKPETWFLPWLTSVRHLQEVYWTIKSWTRNFRKKRKREAIDGIVNKPVPRVSPGCGLEQKAQLRRKEGREKG